MKHSILLLTVLFLFSLSIHAQEEKIDSKKTYEIQGAEKVDSPQLTGDKVIFKDGTTTLLEIENEGSAGSIMLPSVGIVLTGSKLYSNGVNLFWGNSQLNGSNGATVINDLSDAKYDESSLFIGNGAGGTLDDGNNFNVAVGKNALNSNTSGDYNTANGYQSLYSNESGVRNTANGYQSLYSNTEGNYNTANGYFSLGLNTSGDYNTANGYQSLYSNETGVSNTANGFYSLRSNTEGDDNTANGYYSLYLNTTGFQNTANGYRSLYSNETGFGNTANGYQSLYSNTMGRYNTANGYQSLYLNETGWGNTANGSYSLYSNTSGDYNTANGNQSLYSNTEGDYNTANGYEALLDNTEGRFNTGSGRSALANNTTGSYNTAVGYGAGPTSSSLSNTTALGTGALTSESHTIAIGNTNIGSIKGQVAFSTFSDGRYKRNVQEDITGIDFILGLRPVSYNIDINSLADKLGEDIQIDENGLRAKRQPSVETISARNEKASKRQIGFIAQEVEDLADNLGFDFSGVDAPQNEESMYALRYAEFVVPLVKAVQEQQEMITNMQAENEEMRKEIDELKRGVVRQ